MLENKFPILCKISSLAIEPLLFFPQSVLHMIIRGRIRFEQCNFISKKLRKTLKVSFPLAKRNHVLYVNFFICCNKRTVAMKKLAKFLNKKTIAIFQKIAAFLGKKCIIYFTSNTGCTLGIRFIISLE